MPHTHADHHKHKFNHRLRVAIMVVLAVILYAVLSEHLTVRNFATKIAECIYLVVTERVFKLD